MASGPITSWQTEEEKVEKVTNFPFLGSKITETVTAAMKLKDACCLEGKLCLGLTNLDSVLKSIDITLLTKVCKSQSYGFFQ